MIPEPLQKLIGKMGEPVLLEVERGAIKKFADAVGDDNSLYWNEDEARMTRYGGVVAPPGFFGWPIQWVNPMPFFSPLREELISTLNLSGFLRLLDGGIEYEFMMPVRANDILLSVMKISDIYRRESKGNTLVFAITETSYTNRNGTKVAIARQTYIAR